MEQNQLLGQHFNYSQIKNKGRKHILMKEIMKLF